MKLESLFSVYHVFTRFYKLLRFAFKENNYIVTVKVITDLYLFNLVTTLKSD